MRQLSPEGLFTIVALSIPAAFMALPSTLGLAAGFIYVTALAGYYYQTVAHIGGGKDGLPYSSGISGHNFWSPLGRALVIVLVAFGPALAAAHFAHWAMGLALALVGVALAPACLLSGYVTGNLLNQVWPPALYEIVARAPSAYAKLCGLVYVTGGVWLGVTRVVAYTFGDGLFGAILLGGMHTMFAIFQASLFRRFLQQEGEKSYGLRY